MIFCVAVVSLYSKFIGNDNSVVGVTVLLAVLVLRQADFGILHITWIALYCRNICYSDDGTTFCKHTVTSTCICSKCDCNSSSDDSWMPQCDHVQSFHFCTGVFTSAWLRCDRSIIHKASGRPCGRYDLVYDHFLQESEKQTVQKNLS